jgi:hypothetical protein
MTIRVKFDGRVLIPEGPVDLPIGKLLEMNVENAPPPDAPALGALSELVDFAQSLPSHPDAPTDGAAQHDHYLYGTAKRP